MAKKEKTESQFMLMREAAEFIHCSKSTVKRRLDEGLLKGVVDGGCIKIYRWSVESYMASLQPVGGVR